MNLIKLTLTFGLCIFIYDNLLSQTSSCGTVVTKDEIEFLKESKINRIRSGKSSSDINYFKIQHHIVRTSEGTGGLSSSVPAQIIEELNNVFIDSDILIYVCNDIEYIDSDTYYDFVRSQEEHSLRSTYNANDAINIYYFNSIYNAPDSVEGYAYYPWQERNFIAIKNSAALSSWVIHEFGHFFGLLHTHETDEHGAEFVDGSNCESAGDLFCDTPADPELHTLNVEYFSCDYYGTETDGHGDPYDPDTHNYMSYSWSRCRDEYSNEQIAEMSYWANESERQSLINLTLLENETISEDLEVEDDIIIVNDVTISNNSDVTLNACHSVTIKKDFELTDGSTLIIN